MQTAVPTRRKLLLATFSQTGALCEIVRVRIEDEPDVFEWSVSPPGGYPLTGTAGTMQAAQIAIQANAGALVANEALLFRERHGRLTVKHRKGELFATGAFIDEHGNCHEPPEGSAGLKLRHQFAKERAFAAKHAFETVKNKFQRGEPWEWPADLGPMPADRDPAGRPCTRAALLRLREVYQELALARDVLAEEVANLPESIARAERERQDRETVAAIRSDQAVYVGEVLAISLED